MREDAVEVVRLDLHPLSDLREREPGMLVHERQHFLRPATSAARTPRTPGRSGGPGGSRTFRRACSRRLCPLPHTLQRIKRLTDLRVLLNQRLKLTQPLLQTAAKLAQHVSHMGLQVAVVLHDIQAPGSFAGRAADPPVGRRTPKLPGSRRSGDGSSRVTAPGACSLDWAQTRGRALRARLKGVVQLPATCPSLIQSFELCYACVDRSCSSSYARSPQSD